MTRHGYAYQPDTCPEHEFGSNGGQPVDDHCSRCGIHWSRHGARTARVQGDRMARQIAAVFDRERATRELMATLRATLAGIASCSTCEVCREAARNAHALAEAWE